MISSWKTCTAALAAALFMAPAFAVTEHDAKFMRNAAEAGMTEVAAGRLAASRSRDPEVRKFANQMVRDHGKNNEELKVLAKRKGVRLPAGLSEDTRDKLADLKREQGRDFDDEYISKFGVRGHGDAEELFSDAADDSDDPAVAAFARKTLPTVRHHLQMARDLDDSHDNHRGWNRHDRDGRMNDRDGRMDERR